MRKLRDFGRWLVRSLFGGPTSTTFRSVLVDELPDKLESRVMYCLGSGTPWSAALICPCGCGVLIQLSLLKQERPHWDLALATDGTPTLAPSVWRTAGCKSHFLLKKGEVIWCKSALEPPVHKSRLGRN